MIDALRKAELARDAALDEARRLAVENTELRATRFRHFNSEDCWVFLGDGSDHLESLICPVLIQPRALMELLDRAAQPTAAEAKRLATTFFRWWYNKPGANTDDGFDEWWALHGAEYAAAPADDQARRDAGRRFPMQGGPSIPWALAEVLYAGYAAMFGTKQSLETLAARSGLGWAEVEHIYADPRGRRAIDTAQAASAAEGDSNGL